MPELPGVDAFRAFVRTIHPSPQGDVPALRRPSSIPPAAVAELDLTAPIVPFDMPPHVAVTYLLVRAGPRPVGWARVERQTAGEPADWLGNALVGIRRRMGRAVLLERTAPSPPEQLAPISVIICTRNRTESLERCLDSVRLLEYPDYEVIVVDNAPDSDATAKLAERYPVRYVREERPGLDWARNRGIAMARHPVVAFTDDDVRVDRYWLQGIGRAFARADVGLVTGFVAPGSLETAAEQLFEHEYGGMGKGFVPRIVHPDRRRPYELLGTHHLGVGANMAFRRDVLDRIGGFDTALDVGTPTHGGGDLDAFHRALMSGAAARYEPCAMVWHFHRPTARGLRRQMYDNGRAFGAYLIARLRDRRLPRAVVLGYALRWMLWLAGRTVRRFLRRERMPIPYVLSEIWGATHAPWGYVRARRRDARLRAVVVPTDTR